ncbi:hypothetical protein HDV05_007642 [Chytridiales sp. JEL 0842]|nr:hypothetical protein HDV05_007642 [Chytridiales sp. JEL 0842]
MKFFDYKVETIRPLNDARAVELGASFMSEALLFGVAGLTIFAEAWRSSRKAGAKTLSVDESLKRLEADRLSDLEIIGGLREQVEYLGKENDCLREAVHTLTDVLAAADGKTTSIVGAGGSGGGWWPLGAPQATKSVHDIYSLTLEAEKMAAMRQKLMMIKRNSPLGTDVVESGIEKPLD